jgi:hypothetical protein
MIHLLAGRPDFPMVDKPGSLSRGITLRQQKICPRAVMRSSLPPQDLFDSPFGAVIGDLDGGERKRDDARPAHFIDLLDGFLNFCQK